MLEFLFLTVIFHAPRKNEIEKENIKELFINQRE